MPNNHSIVTTAYRKSADLELEESIGSLTYTLHSPEITLFNYETEQSETATSAYLFLDSESFWTFYRVENNQNQSTLARYYMHQDMLLRQEYVGIQGRPWLLREEVFDEEIALGLQNISTNILKVWQKDFEIVSFNNDALKQNSLNAFLKQLIYTLVVVQGLNPLKQDSDSRKEYEQALVSARTGEITHPAITKIKTQNNIRAFRSLLYPTNIFSLVRSFLARNKENTRISFASVYEFCMLIIHEELKQYVISDNFTSVILPQSLRDLELTKEKHIDMNLIDALYNTYTNNDFNLTFIELDAVTQAFKKDPNYSQEMDAFYAIIKAETELYSINPNYQLSEEHLFLLVKKIEAKINLCLNRLEQQRLDQMKIIGGNFISYSMLYLAAYIKRCRDPEVKNKIDNHDVLLVKMYYTWQVMEKLMPSILNENATAAISEMSVSLYLAPFDEVDSIKIKQQISNLINYLNSTLSPHERKIIKNSKEFRDLIANHFAFHETESIGSWFTNHFAFHETESIDSWFAILHKELNDITINNIAYRKYFFIKILCSLTRDQCKQFFLSSNLFHFQVIKKLLPDISKFLENMFKNENCTHSEWRDKDKFFRQINAGVLLYEYFFHGIKHAKLFNFEDLDQLIEVLKFSEFSQEKKWFYHIFPYQLTSELQISLESDLNILEKERRDALINIKENAGDYSAQILERVIMRLQNTEVFRNLSNKQNYYNTSYYTEVILSPQEHYFYILGADLIKYIFDNYYYDNEQIKKCTLLSIKMKENILIPSDYLRINKIFSEEIGRLIQFIRDKKSWHIHIESNYFLRESIFESFVTILERYKNSYPNLFDITFSNNYPELVSKTFSNKLIKRAKQRQYDFKYLELQFSFFNRNSIIDAYLDNWASVKHSKERAEILLKIVEHVSLEEWPSFLFHLQNISRYFEYLMDAFNSIRENANYIECYSSKEKLIIGLYTIHCLTKKYMEVSNDYFYLVVENGLKFLMDINGDSLLQVLVKNHLISPINHADVLEKMNTLNSKYFSRIDIDLLKTSIIYFSNKTSQLEKSIFEKLQEGYYERCMKVHYFEGIISQVHTDLSEAHKLFLNTDLIYKLKNLPSDFSKQLQFECMSEVFYLNKLSPLEKIIINFPHPFLVKKNSPSNQNYYYYQSQLDEKITQYFNAQIYVQLYNSNNSDLAIEGIDQLAKLLIYFPWNDNKKLINLFKKYKNFILNIINSDKDFLLKLNKYITYQQMAVIYFYFYYNSGNDQKERNFLFTSMKLLFAIIEKANIEQFLHLIPKVIRRSLCMESLLNRTEENYQFILGKLEENIINFICPNSSDFSSIPSRFDVLYSKIDDINLRKSVLTLIDDYFTKTYSALRIGNSSLFKTNFIKELDQYGNNKENRVKHILAHIANSPLHSRSRQAWKIMLMPQKERMKEIYYQSFKASPWWARSYCPETATNLYRSEGVHYRYIHRNNEEKKSNWAKKLNAAKERPGSRLNKIISTLGSK